jgi:DNA modification methylase
MEHSEVRIGKLPPDERPREKLIKYGADALSTAELLAIVLRVGTPGKSALALAEQLLVRFGDLRGVSKADIDELFNLSGIGFAKAAQIKAAIELSKRLNEKGEVSTKSDLVNLALFDNTQFIYELDLARMELEALSGNVSVDKHLREMFVPNKRGLSEILRRRVAYFKTVNGEFTDYYLIQRYNRTRSVNQYLTHWFYPYKGKFHPQMIRALLNIIGVRRGETVLDPFIGSGTTSVECQLLGINSIGFDISPLCVLISKVKTESEGALERIAYYVKEKKAAFNIECIEKIEDEKVRNFFKLAEMIAHSDVARRRKNFNRSYAENVIKMFKSINDFRLVKEKLRLRLGSVRVEKADARALPLEDASVDAIITSPPYSIALNYVKNDAHALRALGLDIEAIKDQFIGVRGSGLQKLKLYEKDMKLSIKEMARVLKPGGACVIVIGNIKLQRKEVPTDKMMVDYCEDVGLMLENRIEKIIYGLYNVMQKEWILIFKK